MITHVSQDRGKRPTKDVYVRRRDGSAFDWKLRYRPPRRQNR
jgi:hypothetical protein